MLRRDVGELAVAVSAHSFSTCVDCQSASGLAAVSGKARKGSHNSSLPRIHFPFDQCSTLAWSPEVRPTRRFISPLFLLPRHFITPGLACSLCIPFRHPVVAADSDIGCEVSKGSENSKASTG